DWGCDSNNLAAFAPVGGQFEPAQPSCIPDYNLDPAQFPFGGAYKATIAQPQATILDEMNTAGIPWKIYAAQPADTGGAFWAGCPSFASCLDVPANRNNLVESGQFFLDAASGQLPAVSFLMPEGRNGTLFDGAFSQHNSQSNAAGDQWIGKIAQAVMSGP